MLDRITITGADDLVDVGALAALTERFPFVEWGILASPKRTGTARYPSEAWIGDFAAAHLPSSLHLCGENTRITLAGNDRLVAQADRLHFGRVQINGWTPAPELAGIAGGYDVELILQARDVGAVEMAAVHVLAIQHFGGRASVLYDPSGGTGRRLSGFPTTYAGVCVGYAGGIGPDNVKDVIGEAAETVDAPFWIDMESGVRTGDAFDIEKVERVLESAALFVCRARRVAREGSAT